MTPTVMPAARSAWRSSFHLYFRIHATHGKAASAHSTGLMPRALSTAAHHQGGEEEETNPKPPGGCRSGITFTGLPPPDAAVASSPELLDA